MARHKLSLEQQLKGVRAAIRSKRTPPQLREGLRRRAEWLEEQIRIPGTANYFKSQKEQNDDKS
jgi:hypothetical protein